MKKKVAKCALLIVFIIIIVFAIFNTYKWVVSGEQYIKISTSSKAYTNSNLYVSIIAQKNGLDLDTKSKVKLLNSNGKKVKNAEVTYDGDTAVISIPEIEAGNYFIEATVSSKAGKDTVQKEIYVSDGRQENITITLDKGIYKPGDSVNFRALLTNEYSDEPITKEANICIYDGNDNKVYNENVTTSEYGIVSGKFTLANEVNSGIYKLVVKTNTNETTKQFKVNPYITPKYEIKIGYDKENYLVGDTATISINANYFFGEAVSKANYTMYINGEKYKVSSTDEQGNATVNYEIKEAKTYTVKVEAVDSSNYFVEETSTFVAGTDIFEVELLPEYGSLEAEKTNDVYVFTKKADGTPIKTYVTVSSGNFTKQVATDDNGIGKFSISIDNNQAARTFKINAVNTNGESLERTVSLNVEVNRVLLSTDKVKYKQGEEIKLNISSITENTKNVYFFKNDKLIKMLSTEADETTVNLDDEYGLIDIYVSDKISYSKANSYKKTIFIKPNKSLNIGITTDKQEYKPGDNIKISFGTTDENNNTTDAALLVSMLDNSILSLADNDLSIDNIKLALSNIQFSDEVDAATLYSCIIDDASEQTMMGLLLKQNSRDINVSETIVYNYEEEEKAASLSIILIAIVVVITICYLCFKFPKFRSFMKHSINLVVITFTVYLFAGCIIEEYFWRFNHYGWMLILTVIICLANYIGWIAKLNKKIFKTSISLILTLIILMAISIVFEIFDLPIMPVLIIIALLLLTYAILTKVKKLKSSKFITKTSKTIIYICKFIGALIISFIIGRIVEEIINIYLIFMPITIISVYLFNYLFNKSKMKELKEDKNKETVGFYIVCGLAGIGVLAILGVIALIMGNSQRYI